MTSTARSDAGAPAAARPPLARAWLLWSLGAVFYCYGFFQRVAPSVMVDSLMRDFAVGAAIAGTLSSLYFYAYAGLQIPVGLLVDRFGPRRVLSVAALVGGAGSALFAAADGLEAAYAGRALIGAGAAFGWVATLSLAAAWFPARRFALVSGLTLAFGMAGGIGGQAPLAVLIDAVGWRATLAGGAVFSLGLAVLIAIMVRDRPETPFAGGTGADDAAASAAPAGSAPPRGLVAGLRAALATAQVYPIALFGAAMSAPMLTFAALWGVPYLVARFEIDRPTAALVASAMLAGWAVGAPAGGWLSDRLGRRRLPMVVAASVALASLTAAFYAPGLGLAAVAPLLVVNGLASGTMVVGFAAAREHAPRWAAGSTIGIVNMAVMTSGALFQPLTGWLLDRAWDGGMRDGAPAYTRAMFDTALWPLLAMGVAGVVGALAVRETGCRPRGD
ncbi:MAG: MFS transporter [Azospirillaceae bacterium]